MNTPPSSHWVEGLRLAAATDHLRVRHAGDTAVLADVGGDALQGHDGARTCHTTAIRIRYGCHGACGGLSCAEASDNCTERCSAHARLVHTCLLGDLSLLDINNVHDDAALEHLRHASLRAQDLSAQHAIGKECGQQVFCGANLHGESASLRFGRHVVDCEFCARGRAV